MHLKSGKVQGFAFSTFKILNLTYLLHGTLWICQTSQFYLVKYIFLPYFIIRITKQGQTKFKQMNEWSQTKTEWISQTIFYVNQPENPVFSTQQTSFNQFQPVFFQMIGGSNKSVVLYTKDGVKLGNVGDQDSWIWCCAARPGNSFGIGIILGKGMRFFSLENLN